MASTNATFPASAMSMMSPPARGQSMTRLPFRISTPSTSRLRSSGLPSCSLKKSTLLPVREAHDIQDEELIDLPSVEQVAGALGGDLGIVGEDDGGGEQHVPLSLLSNQHRPRLQVLAPFRYLS